MTLHGISSGDDTESSRRIREGGSWEQPDLKDSSHSLFQVTISPSHQPTQQTINRPGQNTRTQFRTDTVSKTNFFSIPGGFLIEDSG